MSTDYPHLFHPIGSDREWITSCSEWGENGSKTLLYVPLSHSIFTLTISLEHTQTCIYSEIMLRNYVFQGPIFWKLPNLTIPGAFPFYINCASRNMLSSKCLAPGQWNENFPHSLQLLHEIFVDTQFSYGNGKDRDRTRHYILGQSYNLRSYLHEINSITKYA